jgi:hypothetical protein
MERCSRRPLSIPPEHILLIAREKLFNGESHIDLDKVLSLGVGNEECDWLLANYKQLKLEPSGRADYYIAILSDDPEVKRRLLRQSADKGFLPAMAEFGFSYGQYDIFLQAVKLEDPLALFYYGFGEKDQDALLKSATLGHSGAMLRLELNYDDDRFLGLSILYGGREHFTMGKFSPKFTIGQQLEGYKQIWNDGVELRSCWNDCVELYLNVTHAARRAALQTLQIPGLHRDVLQIIAKLVYSSRWESDMWQRAS